MAVLEYYKNFLEQYDLPQEEKEREEDFWRTISEGSF